MLIFGGGLCGMDGVNAFVPGGGNPISRGPAM